MSEGRGLEGSPGLELLLRLVAGQLGSGRCEHCQGSLSGSTVALREHDLRQVVVEVTCRSCGEAMLLRVEPEADDGVARVS